MLLHVEALLPQLLIAETHILPEVAVAPKSTVMLLLPAPEFKIAPDGKLHK